MGQSSPQTFTGPADLRPPIRIDELDALRRRDQVQPLWLATEARCPGASPFVRWSWVGPWLDVYGPGLSPRLLFGRRGGPGADDQAPVGVALISSRRTRRRGVFPVQQLFLNTAGENETDSVCVEYNQLLSPPEDRTAFAAALLRHLAQERDWDEVVLSGFAPEDLPWLALSDHPLWSLEERRRRPCYAMDLGSLRLRGLSPELALSKNTRQQITRSLRLLGGTKGRESLILEEAQTLSEALSFLSELAELHQSSWVSRGESGVFASDRFLRFHREVLALAFPRGAQLLRLRGPAGRTLGVSYNLLDASTVYYYQSGLHKTLDPREKPGLCLHLLAMEHSLAAGHDLYDFMASDARYKRSLSNTQRTLVWAAIQRPRARLYLERLAVRAVQAVRRLSHLPGLSLLGALPFLRSPQAPGEAAGPPGFSADTPASAKTPP